MQKISIFIDLEYKGSFGCGEGKFSIVLEAIKNEQIATKQHFRGYRNTTKNRVALLACIDALSYVKVPCEIDIHIYSPYVVGSVNLLDKWQQEGIEKRKNADLWKKYIEKSKQHLISFVNEKANQYTPAMDVQRQINEFAMQEDYREENELKEG